MSKFTKTLVAAAIAGFASTSVTAGCVNGFYATAQGKQAKLDINASKCDKFKLETDMTLFLSCTGEGSNTGEWDSTVFDFGLEGNGEGPYIASKPDRTLVMDQSGGDFQDFEDFMDDYVFENCSPDNGGYNYDTVLKKFEAKVSKNGDKVKVQWDSEGTYTDFDGNKDKDRKIKTKLKAKLDNVD